MPWTTSSDRGSPVSELHGERPSVSNQFVIDRHGVAVASLDDLVDYAIDTNSRVIYDPERGEFGVADGRTLYAVSEERPDGDAESVETDPRADSMASDSSSNAKPSTDSTPADPTLTETDGGEPAPVCDSDET